LVLFQHAKNWKKYFSRQIRPYIKGTVLEVGPGIGATTLLLNDGTARQWLMLEPDEHMSNALVKKIEAKELPSNCQLQTGTIDQVTATFDTIIYIDVLEHIIADAEEMKKAAALLRPGGHIIVLSPAFQYLFSPFDKAIGHHRRYNKKLFTILTPPGLQLLRSRYYDSAGYFAALMNKIFLRRKYPTLKQVLFWDNWLVPVSKLTDRLFFFSFGKSIIGTWKKPF
ncbi:MAG: class I SAM-dependent methyltransferase, partial [Ferruginibacter sp.]|nr:class I SAM-dependent methyltransferase [Chitinophagaceae bacterium]